MSSGSRHVIKTEREWIEGMSSEEEEEEEDYKRGSFSIHVSASPFFSAAFLCFERFSPIGPSPLAS
jgi:hypothetical protein